MQPLDRIHLFALKPKTRGENRTSECAAVRKALGSCRTVLDREYVRSLPENDVCIVADDLPNIEQRRFVQFLADAVEKDPTCAYTYAGYALDGVSNGRVSAVQKVAMYNRNPFTPRYRRDDTGDMDVDVCTDNTFACTAGLLCRVMHVALGDGSSPVSRSVACSKLGVRIRCLDPSYDWSGLPRSSRSNRCSVRMDSRENMELLTHRGWHMARLATVDTADVSVDVEPVTVVVTTHDRTATAKLTLESLVSRLRYPRLDWIIADDRSQPGHVRALVDHMVSLGVRNVRVTETNDEHYGLGASLNNALSLAFRTSAVVLTTEDDWYLQHDLDLEPYVAVLRENPKVGAIRLGAMYKAMDHLPESSVQGFRKVTNGTRFSKDRTRMLLNMQVALRHRRLYDTLGLYAENRKPDDVESDMNERFCALTDEGLSDGLCVLWPSAFERNTLDSRVNPFVHFGESTCGHSYEVPAWLKGRLELAEVRETSAETIEAVEVACVTDANGIVQLEKTVRSMREASDGYPVTVHVVAYDEKTAEAVSSVQAVGNGVSVVVRTLSDADREKIDTFATPRNGRKYSVPPVGLVKFMLPRYVDAPKAIYLDTDILVRRPIRELWNEPLDDNIAAAVVDPGCLFLRKEEFPVISGNTRYFNSGVMVLDLDQLRAGDFEAALFHRKKHSPNLKFQDQDVLNMEFNWFTRLLPPRYNVLMGACTKVVQMEDLNRLYGTSYASADELIDDAVVWHWASGDKPWMSGSAPRAEEWFKA